MDYSIESLIAEGTGLKVKDTTFASTSIEAYDGYYDGVCAELSRSFENLEFLDTYSKINAANADAKLRMMKRLKRVYGSTIEDQAKASSVESYIDNNIRSLEADDGKKDGQKKGFFARIIDGLKKMFAAIKNFFQRVWEKIKGLFSKKNENNSEVMTKEQIEELFKETKIKHGAVNKGTHEINANQSGLLLVNFAKIDFNKVKATMARIAKTTDLAANINDANGLKRHPDANGNAPQYVNMNVSKDSDPKLYGEVQAALKMDDMGIAEKYFGAKKASPEEISRLGVRNIVNCINAFNNLHVETNNVEKLLDAKIKMLENKIKSGTQVDEKYMSTLTNNIRNYAKFCTKITSVGVKICTSANKVLVPKKGTNKTPSPTNNTTTAATGTKKGKKTA